MDDKCIECDCNATWVRCTQFAGDHPYCENCAKKEKDFGDNDSYKTCEKIKTN